MSTRRQTRSAAKAEASKSLPKKEPDQINISEDDDEVQEQQTTTTGCAVIQEEKEVKKVRPRRASKQPKKSEKKEEEEEEEEIPVKEETEWKPNDKKAKPRAKKQVAPKKPKEEATAAEVLKQEKLETEEVVISDESPDIIYELEEKELKEINQAFDMNCSQDGDELLGSDDLKTAIRSLGFEPRVDEIKRLLRKFANKKGKVNRDGFHKIMALKMSTSPGFGDKGNPNDEISRVFNLLDLEKTGFITFESLRSISKELNENITDEELNEMIQEADLDGDHKINKVEFHHIMKKTSLY